ncbi:lamin Dm0-like, partial [Drosophila eugracilis]|uniref:lamin Dm0-like n=1 Tax=Drosophila eugracilis TaxID=29029 RepID=UPI001BD9884F
VVSGDGCPPGKPYVAASSEVSSPLSSACRLPSETELHNLNDRLATYIDRLCNLETENSHLSIEVQITRDKVTRGTTNIKNMFEAELLESRSFLDDTARDCARGEIDSKPPWEENEDLKNCLDKKIKECSTAEGNARLYESRFNELSKFNLVNADRKKITDELNNMTKELDRLRKQFEETRKALEQETLSRFDLESTFQSLREELSFKDQNISQKVNESRGIRQTEYSDIIDAKLKKLLQELRAQYEDKETENSHLSIEVQITRDKVTRGTTNIKNMFEAELLETRSFLDDTARDCARGEIDNKPMWEENEDLKNCLDKKIKECSTAEGNARLYESHFNELSKFNLVNADRKKITDELNNMTKELDRLRKQFEDTRKALEQETLSRFDLESTFQSLREELSFKDQNISQKVNESGRIRQKEYSDTAT